MRGRGDNLNVTIQMIRSEAVKSKTILFLL